MNDITLSMALVDFIPVIVCAASVMIQIRVFRAKMQTLFYVLFVLGGIMLVAGGVLKALWKLLYALELGDFQLLSDQFLPVSGAAFVLLAVASIRMLIGSGRSGYQYAFMASSRIPFIAMMFFGMTGWYMSLSVLSFRLKKKGIGLLFILAWIIMTVTSMFSTKFDSAQSAMHWIAEVINIFAQLMLLTGTIALRRALREEYY